MSFQVGGFHQAPGIIQHVKKRSIGNDPGCHFGNRVIIKGKEEGKKERKGRVMTQLVLE